jgi:hypothetical protein
MGLDFCTKNNNLSENSHQLKGYQISLFCGT